MMNNFRSKFITEILVMYCIGKKSLWHISAQCATIYPYINVIYVEV